MARDPYYEASNGGGYDERERGQAPSIYDSSSNERLLAEPGPRSRRRLVKPLAGVAALGVIAAGVATYMAVSQAATAPNPNCTLIVPADPLTAAGLATPFQLTATDAAGGPCNEANANQSAFVQGAIIDANGQVTLYDPLVIDKGTQPIAPPAAATVAAGSTVALWFGFNGTNLTLQSAAGTTALQQGNCVNGAANSIFGQFSYCNAPAWFTAANTAIQNNQLQVPALGTAKDGMPCPTVRDFSLVDQDQSDNVLSNYLANGNGQTGQNNAATLAAVQNAAVNQQNAQQNAAAAQNGAAQNGAAQNGAAQSAAAQGAAAPQSAAAAPATTRKKHKRAAAQQNAAAQNNGAAASPAAAPAQNTAAMAAAMGMQQVAANAAPTNLANGSDNRLLDVFVLPTLGCAPWTKPNMSQNGQATSSLPLNELQAAMNQPAPIALVPLNDPMTQNNANADPAKNNLYRAGVDQNPLGAADNGSGATYCQNLFVNAAGIQRVFKDMAIFVNGTSPDAAMATNLFTFLAMRANQSFTNLNCQNLLNMPNPIQLTMNNGVVTAATFTAAGAAAGAQNGAGASAAAGTGTATSAAPAAGTGTATSAAPAAGTGTATSAAPAAGTGMNGNIVPSPAPSAAAAGGGNQRGGWHPGH